MPPEIAAMKRVAIIFRMRSPRRGAETVPRCFFKPHFLTA